MQSVTKRGLRLSKVSLVAAATSVIFFSTNVLSRRKTSLLSPQKYASHDKTLVATKLCLLQQKFCLDKHTFVMTKDVFCCEKIYFLTTFFFTTKLSSRQAYFCHNKSCILSFLSQQICVCRDKNDSCGSFL